MEITELLAWLTDGLDDAEKAVVTKSVMRDQVKAKAAGFKAQSEFDSIIAERGRLQQELDGDTANGKLGARATREWYEKNSAAVIANDKAIREFETKHGPGSFAKAAAGELPTTASVPGAVLTAADIDRIIAEKVKPGQAMSEADLQRAIDKRFQEQYAPSTANTVVTAGHLLQKHMLAGRKNPIDFNALAKMANEQFAGNMEQAYDKWDEPERAKITASERETEIKSAIAAARQKWDDERIKENATKQFPAGADATPGNLSPLAHAGGDKFDRSSLMREMVGDWNKAGTTVTQ